MRDTPLQEKRRETPSSPLGAMKNGLNLFDLSFGCCSFCLTRKLGGENINHLDFRRLREKFRSLLLQRRSNLAGQVRLAPHLIRKCVEDTEGGRSQPDSKPSSRRWFIFHDGKASAQKPFDIDFLSGPERTGTFNPPSTELVAQKERFGSSRRARWFGA